MVRYHMFRLAGAVLAGVLLAAPLPAVGADVPPAPSQDAPARRAAAGDVLRVVITDPGGGGDIKRRDETVRKDGSIDMPHVGRIKVAGATAAEIKTMLDKAYGAAGVNLRAEVAVRFVAGR